jgi:DNA-binding NarL/FixJ family response regulator
MKKNKKTLRVSIPANLKKVTAKQLHVLQLTAEDRTPALIADEVGNITERGITQRLYVLYDHLEVDSAIAAYRKALLLGLMPLD